MIGDGGHAKVIKSFAPNANVIAIGDNAVRKRIATEADGEWDRAIHPSAILETALIGWGTVIMAGVIVQAGVVIGQHVILNTGCTVDHDCVIEDYAHIAPGAHLCGGVHVGEGALVGVGVGIEPGAKIPAWSIVKRIPYEVKPCPTK